MMLWFRGQPVVLGGWLDLTLKAFSSLKPKWFQGSLRTEAPNMPLAFWLNVQVKLVAFAALLDSCKNKGRAENISVQHS